MCLGHPTSAVKLPESQTCLVIPAVNILGRNSRPPLFNALTRSTGASLVSGHARPPPHARARDPGAVTRWKGCKWKQDGLRFFFSPCRRCCVMGRVLPSALLLLYSRRSLKWHAAVSFYQRQPGSETNCVPAAGRKENNGKEDRRWRREPG